MILKAKGICKSFGPVNVLHNIDLQIETNESIAICGRSGEGKTTLLHILGTLESADKGEIEIMGKKISHQSSPHLRNRHIGFIFQSYNLLEDLTALENVLMPARIARMKIDLKKGLELLDRVGLLEKGQTLAKFLSGGERQRVAIARALCNDPSLILADEPTGNLDRANAKNFSELLFSLKKSVILVTHDSELASLCDKRYVLKDANLNAIATLSSINDGNDITI